MQKRPQSSQAVSTEAAQDIAIQALSYLSGEPELMNRFLALTGIEASDIRAAARDPHFFAGVLRFFLSHEPTLLAFSQAANIAPEQIAFAFHALPGGSEMQE